MATSKPKGGTCEICGSDFLVGEEIQASVRGIHDRTPIWTSARVDAEFQTRILKNADNVTRRHLSCHRHAAEEFSNGRI